MELLHVKINKTSGFIETERTSWRSNCTSTTITSSFPVLWRGRGLVRSIEIPRTRENREEIKFFNKIEFLYSKIFLLIFNISN